MGYDNGMIPPSALVQIGPNKLLRADALAGLVALDGAFRQRFGKPLSITDAYRPKYGISTAGLNFPHQFSQAGIFEDRYPHLSFAGVNDRRGPWKGKYWWRRPGTAAAAVPGTSQHGWGLALDLGSNVNNYGTPENNWVRENAGRFGWWWPTWARKSPSYEPWHYEFVGTAGFPIGNPGSIGIPTTPGTPGHIEEESMSAEDREVISGHINTVAQEARAFHAAVLPKLDQILTEVLNTKAGVWTGGKATIDGVVQTFNYGTLPIVTHSQALAAQAIGRLTALEALVKQLLPGATASGAPIDLDAISAAAEDGLRRALADVQVESTATTKLVIEEN